MKIHIVSLGFTPEVFTRIGLKTGGIDRIIIVRHREEDPENKKRAEAAIEEIEHFTGIKTETEFAKERKLMPLIFQFMRLLTRFGKDDEIFLHIGGGERHIPLALLYASFFVKRNINIVATVRQLSGQKIDFEYEMIPAAPLYRPMSKTPRKILETLDNSGPLKLMQIVKKMPSAKSKKDESRLAPGVYKHLEKLRKMNYVRFDEGQRLYSISKTGKLLLNSFNL